MRRALNRYRILVLGAGFSKPAGLPLCAELFSEIVALAKLRGLYKVLKKDIDRFLEYIERTKSLSIAESEINFEEFISFLDVEHFLQLKGSDHWSTEGLGDHPIPAIHDHLKTGHTEVSRQGR